MSGKRKPPFPPSPADSGDEERLPPTPAASPDYPGGHEYDNAASPSGSSTASGPVYIRPPGFTKHAQEVLAPTTSTSSKGKKKKGLITIDAKDVLRRTPEAVTPSNSASKPRTKKEPLPMKLRALPQSFWQQPNVAPHVSPATLYPVLPPLFSREVAEVRPVSPSEEKESLRDKDRFSKNFDASSNGRRIVTVTNTDLLYRLFDRVQDPDIRRPPIVKRGRPKKTPSTLAPQTLRGEDPCLVSTVTESILPLLPLDRTGGGGAQGSGLGGRPPPQQTLAMISLRDGDKAVSLPSLNVEHNYSQLLSELVVKL